VSDKGPGVSAPTERKGDKPNNLAAWLTLAGVIFTNIVTLLVATLNSNPSPSKPTDSIHGLSPATPDGKLSPPEAQRSCQYIVGTVKDGNFMYSFIPETSFYLDLNQIVEQSKGLSNQLGELHRLGITSSQAKLVDAMAASL
jgi:hypothetical protein